MRGDRGQPHSVWAHPRGERGEGLREVSDRNRVSAYTMYIAMQYLLPMESAVCYAILVLFTSLQ